MGGLLFAIDLQHAGQSLWFAALFMIGKCFQRLRMRRLAQIALKIPEVLGLVKSGQWQMEDSIWD